MKTELQKSKYCATYVRKRGVSVVSHPGGVTLVHTKATAEAVLSGALRPNKVDMFALAAAVLDFETSVMETPR